MLPNDIARCMGVGVTENGERRMREGCMDCQRRTGESKDYFLWYMSPPAIIETECEYRIEP